MIPRSLKLDNSNSFFLFGARGTGKSTLLRQSTFLKNALWLDFLNPDTEQTYSLRPMQLESEVKALPKDQWVVLDEIQKVPALLDVVHSLIESRNTRFALTGSSARKLKRGSANLLAGRAFVFSLFPFNALELGDRFNLEDALRWGTLPKIFDYPEPQRKRRFLRTYVQTYLKEEIMVEQLVRNLPPFRLFLPIAAQMNAQIVNHLNIAKDTGVDPKTVQTYYQILVDTHLGHFLNPYSRSVRKVQIQSPKFYLFDTGVKRALQNRLNVPLERQTTEYGELFETWFLNECFKSNSYRELDFTFSYLRTKEGVEIDLIVDRPGKSQILVEIKSKERIDSRDIRSLLHFQNDFPRAELMCVAQVPRVQKIDRVRVLPWREALKRLGLG